MTIIGTFLLGGALRRAGLWVRRYGEEDIRELVGPGIELVSTISETHLTPGGIQQPCAFFVLRRGEEK